LGAVIGLTDLVRAESILEVLKTRIPAAFVEMNQEALQLGMALVAAYKK